VGIVQLLISIACADDARGCPNPNEERCELGVVVYILPNPKGNVEEGYALGLTKGAKACWAYCGEGVCGALNEKSFVVGVVSSKGCRKGCRNPEEWEAARTTDGGASS
jgi:hypothetical protein